MITPCAADGNGAGGTGAVEGPTLSQEQALLAAVREQPDDDLPRLAYADWLEEHGQADRAEFIRAQVELGVSIAEGQPHAHSALGVGDGTPAPRGTRTRRRDLERRVKALWKQHRREWAAQPWGGSENLEYWERGFCAHCQAEDVASLIAILPRRLNEAPIQHAHVSATRRQDIARLVEFQALSRLRTLDLFAAWSRPGEEPEMGDADVALLADCPYLSRLEYLDLTQHHVGPEGVSLLAHSAKLPSLRALGLYGNRLDDECVRILATSPLAARLRGLHLSGITAAGARVLGTTRALAQLTRLNLDNTSIGDAGARALAGAAHLSNLTGLWLHSCEIGNAGVKALASSPHLANLEVLDLTSNWTVGHPAAVALVRSPFLKRIRYLDLWRCEGMSQADQLMLRKRFRSRVNFGRSY